MSMKSNKLKSHLTQSCISPWADQSSLHLSRIYSGMITTVKS